MRVGNEGLKHIVINGVGNLGLKRMVINGGKKHASEIIFNKFIEQLEPKENFRINRLKLMTYKPEAEESLDDFVNRCR